MATIIFDNGAGTAKIGYSTDNEPKVMPNCITKAKNVRTRIFIGDQIDECKDLSGLYYLLPFQKGYLVNWDLEKQIWDYALGKNGLKVDFTETDIIVTEPYFNFASIQEGMNELLFEEYQFKSVLRTNPGFLSQYKVHKEESEKHLCTVIVDSGYSFTHILPYFKGSKIREAIRRVNVGGKLATNHLKEIISYRQLMVMDETYVINQLKEDVCYVSLQFNKDMEIARKKGIENTIVRDYILPDYTHINRGYARSSEESTGKAQGQEQIIKMNNERFAVPELIFRPTDVSIQEMGLTEAFMHSMNSTQEEMQPHLLNNIVLVGGNCLIPNFKERVQMDIRSMAPDEMDVNITVPANPITHAWQGGAMLASDPKFRDMVVTREQYEEHGHGICFEKFDV